MKNKAVLRILKEISEIVGHEVHLYFSDGGWLRPATELQVPTRNEDKGLTSPILFSIVIDPVYVPRNEQFHIEGYYKADTIAQFQLQEFPGCCAFCVSTGAWVSNMYRNKGINTLLNEMRQEMARRWGYTSIICTDVADNKPQRRVLEKNGFRDIYRVLNKRTGNVVNISIKEL